MMVKRTKPDQGYAWVIVGASCMAHTIQYGIAWTVGVFFDIFRTQFSDSSNGAIALISSLNTCSFFIAGPVAGVLTNQFGHRVVAIVGGLVGSLGLMTSIFATKVWHLYVTYGILTGFSFGLSYIPSITIVGPYFEKKRTIALGVAVSGCGIGVFVFPPLIRLFVNEYGWRGGTLLTGAVCLNICVCGALMRPAQVVNENESKENGDEQTLTKKDHLNLFIFKNIDYLILCFNNVLFSFGLSVVYVHLGAYGETLGCSKDQGAMLFSAIGISNFFGRILFGVLAHFKTIGPLCWYLQGLTVCGVVTMMAPLAFNYPGLLAYAAAFGLLSACIGPLLPQIQVEFLDVSLLANAYGYLLIFEAIGQLLGAPVAGWLYDQTGHYPFSLYLGGATILLSGLMMIFPWYRNRKKGAPHAHMTSLEMKVNTYVSGEEVVPDQ